MNESWRLFFLFLKHFFNLTLVRKLNFLNSISFCHVELCKISAHKGEFQRNALWERASKSHQIIDCWRSKRPQTMVLHQVWEPTRSHFTTLLRSCLEKNFWRKKSKSLLKFRGLFWFIVGCCTFGVSLCKPLWLLCGKIEFPTTEITEKIHTECHRAYDVIISAKKLDSVRLTIS